MNVDAELIQNADDGNLDSVRDLLQRGANVNARNELGGTALYCASWNGNVEVVRALLNREGVDVNSQDDCGWTALIRASSNGHLEVVCALLNHNGVDVNIKNKADDTALICASVNGHSEVVRALLNHKEVNVNIMNSYSNTALICASVNGHLEVVRALLNHNDMDVNIKNNDGNTGLICASVNGHFEVVQALLNHKEVNVNIKNEKGETALDVARDRENDDTSRLLEENIAQQIRRQEPIKARIVSVADGRSLSDDVKIEQERSKLLDVMKSISDEPVELSSAFIQRCLTTHKLGSGAFGDVYLAEDSSLRKRFAVTLIRPTQIDEASINEFRKAFQTEFSAMKRYGHPNIATFYGFSLNANKTEQYLVYEYTANGSLDSFFTDDGNRARLSADTRLSIMYELARTVHFLHVGGCHGWKVVHRDIKSSNVYLTDDFSPRLIDCGLSKFVPDENSDTIPDLVTPSLRNTNGGTAFGSPGYMCPDYVRRKRIGLPCPYKPAYDVYSLGVVMTELILGCVNSVQSTRNGTQFYDVFVKYVQNEDHEPIIGGWHSLSRDADPSIVWNSDVLYLACRSAVQCMAPFSEERLTTKALLDDLSEAIRLNAYADR